jgi:hypothetical protein
MNRVMSDSVGPTSRTSTYPPALRQRPAASFGSLVAALPDETRVTLADVYRVLSQEPLPGESLLQVAPLPGAPDTYTCRSPARRWPAQAGDQPGEVRLDVLTAGAGRVDAAGCREGIDLQDGLQVGLDRASGLVLGADALERGREAYARGCSTSRC